MRARGVEGREGYTTVGGTLEEIEEYWYVLGADTWGIASKSYARNKKRRTKRG